MSKKKKIIVLASMVALLVLTGCLNYFLNRPTSDPANAEGSLTYSDYFSASRADRSAAREEAVLYYTMIKNDEASSAEAKANAEAELAALAAGVDTEQRLETLIKSLGFEDCIVTVGKENINVIVKSDALTEQEAAQLLDMVCSETGKSVGYVRVKSIDL
ncbi:MAG: SpoIIIAH-like family protein [Clostridiales bacterium]|nr:SpoIIIAH-like family protein [Clostridiales bacterium]